MVSYLIKLFILTLFSFFVIYNFYFNSPGHIENFDGYFPYIAIVGILYVVYKYIQLSFTESDIVKFTPAKITGYFLLHLFIISSLSFVFVGSSFGGGIALFFKILFYSILPVSITLITTSLGYKLGKFLPDFKDRNTTFRFLLALAGGFFTFVFALTIFGMFGFYNLYVVFLLLAGALIYSWKEFSSLTDAFFTYSFEVQISEGNYMKLITAEFFFIVLTLVLSTNLINIVRPFPIGWDDLGAYMNYPHLFVEAGNLREISGMLSWQTFTGIGYMFGTPVQAFFLNNVGGFLTAITLVLVSFDLLKSKVKSSYIHIPMMLATLFVSLPMVVFQQAKDMKLDTGLFFISVISVYLLFQVILKGIYSNDIDRKNTLKYIFVVGLLAGFAFTIKFTALLLILGLLGVLVYSKLNIEGFLGYLAIFFAVFTKGKLWGLMNVVYPEDDIKFINTFFIISFVVGVSFLGYAIVKYKVNLIKIILKIGIFFLGIFIAMLPWLGKNIYTSYPDLSVTKLVSGTAERFDADYSLLYSQEELLEKKQNAQKGRGITSSGTTVNEDFGRYFGYESGINNYVKLPWNLTMQVNQGGEFTGIGYVFLALLPALFLFLPYRRKEYAYGAVLFLVGIFLLHGLPITSAVLTELMSQIGLPFGYLIILSFFLIPALYVVHGLKDITKNRLFILNFIFFAVYTFLWSISAFGIVWYGIVMYFSFLIMIGGGLYHLSSYKQEDDEKVKQVKLFGSIVLLLIVSIYFFNSVFPHTFNNLARAGYKEFKLGKINTIEAPFSYHKEYLPILFALNIAEDKKFEYISARISDEVKKIVPTIENYDISTIQAILEQIVRSGQQPIAGIARKDLNKIYKGILSPEEEYKSDVGIYRIGTFLRYYISENNKRLLEDSLINKFDNYIYTGNINTTVDNIKKLGLGYLLVDLNAATIDQDPNHTLTNRYENLMRTFSSDKLELVDTDSMCLKIAIDDYQSSSRDQEAFNHFYLMAGVNYDSYDQEGNKIDRRQKVNYCYNYIIQLIEENKINQEQYPYLLPIKQNTQGFTKAEEYATFFAKYVTPGYKVLFKVK